MSPRGGFVAQHSPVANVAADTDVYMRRYPHIGTDVHRLVVVALLQDGLFAEIVVFRGLDQAEARDRGAAADDHVLARVDDRGHPDLGIFPELDPAVIGGHQAYVRIEHDPVVEDDLAVLADFQVNPGHQRNVFADGDVPRITVEPQNQRA